MGLYLEENNIPIKAVRGLYVMCTYLFFISVIFWLISHYNTNKYMRNISQTLQPLDLENPHHAQPKNNADHKQVDEI